MGAICAILAFAFPCFVIIRYNKRKLLRNSYLYSVASFAFCSAAIIMALYSVKVRVYSGDIGGILDTIDAELMIVAALAALVGIINFIALGLSYSDADSDKNK